MMVEDDEETTKRELTWRDESEILVCTQLFVSTAPYVYVLT